MSIEHADVVDFVTIDEKSGDVWLTVSDHLAWDQHESDHLIHLQSKLNSYLRFVESGEILQKCPEAKGRNVVINVVGQFPLSDNARQFFERARALVREAGFDLRFEILKPN